MNEMFLLVPIILPLIWGLVCLLLPAKISRAAGAGSVLVMAATVISAVVIFQSTGETRLLEPWAGFGINFDLRAYPFSKFILLAASGFEVLIALYAASSLGKRDYQSRFFAFFCLTAAAANGAVLANNLVLLLVFLGAVLPLLYAMISLESPDSGPTAKKALVLSGVVDFMMVLGVVLLASRTGTLTMSEIQVEATGTMAVAFLLMALAAMFKAGAMPMHTWIPDAATDSPLPFMAFLPAAIEKLLGIYMLSRICLEFFVLPLHGYLSLILMSVGAITVVAAVLMALIQKNYKKLLAFHAVSQVGYMILGIGTGVPIGIAGGIFHMLNHAMYKSLLFLTAGSVEAQTGTSDIRKLGGLARSMPVTAGCFAVAALSIAGVPPFNGFVSKEMVFHGTYETGQWIFLIAAWVGAIFTFASFLKLGHSVYLGKPSAELGDKKIRESSPAMLVPMLVLAFGCVLFGVYNRLPLQNFVEPVLEHTYVLEEGAHELEFWKHSFSINWIALVSMGALGVAFLLHLYGVRRAKGKAYMASEPIHNLPGLHKLYELAEKRFFDIYEWGFGKATTALAEIVFRLERLVDAFYEVLVTRSASWTGQGLAWLHNGLLANFAIWVLVGMSAVMYMIFR